ncbi:MAG: hypothetical protein HRT68_10235 [Flavobacteriaceae bacterium]|nr:hypothetical protein [Flavobacteriaceae bacterium]
MKNILLIILLFCSIASAQVGGEGNDNQNYFGTILPIDPFYNDNDIYFITDTGDETGIVLAKYRFDADSQTWIDVTDKVSPWDNPDDSIALQSSTNIKYDEGFVGIGVKNATAPLHVGATLQENSTYRGMLIESPTDDNFWGAITIQAGTTNNQRRYFEYKNHLGQRTNLLGFNAINSFIAWDAINQYHFFTADSGSNTRINAGPGNFGINFGVDQNPTGSGGITIYDGSIGGTFPTNAYARINTVGVSSQNGKFVQAFAPNNSDYTRLFTQNTKSYIRGTQVLEISTGGNEILFSGSTFGDKMKFDLSTGEVSLYDYGLGNFDDPNPARSLGVDPSGNLVEFTPTIVPVSSKVLDTGLNSGTQDTNYPTEIYQWGNSGINGTYISIVNSDQEIVFNQPGQYNINSSLRVTNATANNRSKFQIEITHYDSGDIVKAVYKGSESYIRDDVVTYDDGASAIFTSIVAEIGDYITVSSNRLHSEDPTDDNPANLTESNLLIHFFEYKINNQ